MNWAEFFAMGGRGAFVWGSFGVFALALLIEVVVLRAQSRRARSPDQH
jgi:heme exporter protein D